MATKNKVLSADGKGPSHFPVGGCGGSFISREISVSGRLLRLINRELVHRPVFSLGIRVGHADTVVNGKVGIANGFEHDVGDTLT